MLLLQDTTGHRSESEAAMLNLAAEVNWPGPGPDEDGWTAVPDQQW